MASRDVTSADPGQHPAENRLRSYAHAMDSIGVMIDELCVAIEGCGEAELYDDPEDPLGRAHRMLYDLRHITAEGLRFAEAEQQDSPPNPSLALELRDGADRLSREIPKLAAALANHLLIRDHRSRSTRSGS